MTADDGTSPDSGEAAPQAGVLGNLPRSRPSVRSPRRVSPAPADETSEPGPEAAAAPETGATAESSSQAELEALVCGGLAIAGGAASLGLRVAGRAAAAVRGAVERR